MASGTGQNEFVNADGVRQRLTGRKRLFVDHFLTGLSAADAARAAGYAHDSARHQAWRLLHRDQAVMQAVVEGQQAVREKAEVTAESLLEQLREDREFARETKNATAMVRASEMIGKLTGLMIERRDVRSDNRVTVNIIRYSDENAALDISAREAPIPQICGAAAE